MTWNHVYTYVSTFFSVQSPMNPLWLGLAQHASSCPCSTSPVTSGWLNPNGVAQPSSFLDHQQHLAHWITPFFLKHFYTSLAQAPLGPSSQSPSLPILLWPYELWSATRSVWALSFLATGLKRISSSSLKTIYPVHELPTFYLLPGLSSTIQTVFNHTRQFCQMAEPASLSFPLPPPPSFQPQGFPSQETSTSGASSWSRPETSLSMLTPFSLSTHLQSISLPVMLVSTKHIQNPSSPYYSSAVTLQRKLYEVRNSSLFYSFHCFSNGPAAS